MASSIDDKNIIDVCIPTLESEPVIEETLASLARAIEGSCVSVETLIIVDGESNDETVPLAKTYAEEQSWGFEAAIGDYPLQVARREAIDRVETEWFLFLDDDVRIREPYLERLVDATAPLVGGVQGRKGDGGQNAKWVRWRSHRAGTHATLLRRAAVSDVEFPGELMVFEDEYLRQTVEENGYLWIFNHQARFDHANRGRHPTGWREGYLAGKYGLTSFCFLARKVPAAILARKSPLGGLKRTAGWITGWLTNRGSQKR